MAVAGGALIGGWTIFKSGFSLARRPRMTELAFAVTQNEQPQLFFVANSEEIEKALTEIQGQLLIKSGVVPVDGDAKPEG